MIWAKWVEEDGRYAFALRGNGGVEISAEHHAALISGAESGLVIVPDGDGLPSLAKPDVPADVKQAMVNAEARAYLAETDWYVVRQIETGLAIPDEVLLARASARERVVE